MSQSKSNPDQLLASLLVAYDEALRSDTPHPHFEESIVEEGAPLTDRYRAARECLDLLDRVRRFDRRASDTPATPFDTTCAEPAGDQRWPAQIGRFQIEGELGRGGLGVVLLARDPELNRHVAIKIPRAEIVGRGELARRFLREAEAAARLSHPHLVALYEVGREGEHVYLVWEYCSGPTLAQWLQAHAGPVTPRVAAGLVQPLADAVQHAHSRDVLHRDIKPSNILLTRLESQGRGLEEDERYTFLHAFRPKLTDFGMAKLLESTGDETRTGAILGTPAFMAPEQADGRVHDVDARTDVYALGAVLYQLLTGSPPYRGVTDIDMLRQLVLAEPAAPRRANPAIPRDLEAITLKCLAKQSTARYPTAQYLADDLARFLSGQPTQARPLGAIGGLLKWARRRPAIAALVAVTALCVAALFATIATYNIRLQGEVARADLARDAAHREAQASRRLLYASDVRSAYESLRVNNVVQALDRLKRHIPRPGESDLREFAWYYLRQQCEPNTLTLEGHTGPVTSVAYSPDGRMLATGGGDGTARVWDAATGKPLHVLHDKTKEVTCVAFSPDGRTLAAGNETGAVRLWDPQIGEMVRAFEGHTDQVMALAFSPDGQHLATGSVDKSVRIWHVATGATVQTLGEEMDVIRGVAWSPTGDLLYVVDEAPRIHVWRVADWRRWNGPSTRGEKYFALAVSQRTSRIAAAGRKEEIGIWQSDDNKLLLAETLQGGHTEWILSVAFSPADDTLASAGADGVIQLWNPNERRPARTLLGHTGRVWSVAFSPDGKHLASGGSDRVARIWPLGVDGAGNFPDQPLRTQCARFSSDGKRLFTSSDDGNVRIWDAATHALMSTHPLTAGPLGRLRVAPDDSMVATWCEDGVTRVWSRAKFELLFELPRLAGGGLSLDFSPCGRWLAAIDSDRSVALVDVRSWQVTRRFEHQAVVRDAVFTPDGRRLITLAEALHVWDVHSGKLHYSVPRLVRSLAVSRDGRAAAVGGTLNVTLFDLDAGRALSTLPMIGSDSSHVALHGSTLAVAVKPPPTVCLFDTRTGQELARLDCDGQELDSITFSPDGTRLIATGEDGRKRGRIWEWTIRKRQ